MFNGANGLWLLFMVADVFAVYGLLALKERIDNEQEDCE